MLQKNLFTVSVTGTFLFSSVCKHPATLVVLVTEYFLYSDVVWVKNIARFAIFIFSTQQP